MRMLLRRMGFREGALLCLALALVLLFLAPSKGVAQENAAELHATIRAAIQSDPRSAQMSEAEIEAIVGALAQEAEKQGVTSSDIVWRPTESQPVQQGSCGNVNGFLCALTEAFGFSGSDLVIPIGLGASAAFLLFVLGMMLHRHGHHPVAGTLGPPPLPASPPFN